MADDKTNADVTGTDVPTVAADEPNPKADESGEGTATAEEAVREETGSPLFPVAAAEDTVYETPEPRDFEVEVNDEPVAPQKVGGPIVPVEEVPVYEVYVETDKHVDYVIVPPEGRGDATLPIHAYANGRKPEDVFAEESSDSPDE